MEDIESYVRAADNIIDIDFEPAVKVTDSKLLDLIDSMQRDWCKLNELLNRTAGHFQWCSDYEERIMMYNDEFRVLQLLGREDYGHYREEDHYLLPSLKIKRLLPEDQESEVNAEKAFSRAHRLLGILEEREADLARREEALREREVVINWEYGMGIEAKLSNDIEPPF